MSGPSAQAGFGRRSRPSFLALTLLLAVGVARGDGGLMRLSQTAGPFEITLFTAPTPLRVGSVDVSVLVLTAADHSPVLDAEVELTLRAVDTTGSERTALATHAAATNKLLYAAPLGVPAAGRWTLTARVNANSRAAAVECEVDVQPPQAPVVTFWPFLVLPGAVVALFALHQWLTLQRRAGRPRT